MKILIVNNHQIFRTALINLLRASLDFDFDFYEVSNCFEAIDRVMTHSFDLIFLDISVPMIESAEMCKHIKKIKNNLPIIVLSQYEDRNLVSYFTNIGVHSFLTKDSPIDELKGAICSARNGEKYFPEKNRIDTLHKEVELSAQEKRLILLLQQGLTSKEIAEKMNLTVNTVNTYRDRLLEKTDTINVAQLISFGFRIGVLK